MAMMYTFRGTILLTGALHIGSGGGNEATDATIIRDAQNRPFIPGSAFRGAFRAEIERRAPTMLGPQGRVKNDGELRDALKAAEDAVEEERLKAQHKDEWFNADAVLQDQLDLQLSSIERLFGTVLWASPLLIPDLPLLTGLDMGQGTAEGEIRHGVGIDRDTGAAKDQLKYDFEVLPRDHRFRLLMRCEMPLDYQIDWERLLALGLRLLELGELPLGGRIARGVGQVKLQDLKVFTLDLNKKGAILDALLNGAAQSDQRYGTPYQGNWTQDILDQWRSEEQRNAAANAQ